MLKYEVRNLALFEKMSAGKAGKGKAAGAAKPATKDEQDPRPKRSLAWPRLFATIAMSVMAPAGVFHLAMGLGLVAPPPNLPVNEVFALPGS